MEPMQGNVRGSLPHNATFQLLGPSVGRLHTPDDGVRLPFTGGSGQVHLLASAHTHTHTLPQ